MYIRHRDSKKKKTLTKGILKKKKKEINMYQSEHKKEKPGNQSCTKVAKKQR